MKILKILATLLLFTVVPYYIGVCIVPNNINNLFIITLFGIAVELAILQVGVLFRLILLKLKIWN
jgi:hypothetical protein